MATRITCRKYRLKSPLTRSLRMSSTRPTAARIPHFIRSPMRWRLRLLSVNTVAKFLKILDKVMADAQYINKRVRLVQKEAVIRAVMKQLHLDQAPMFFNQCQFSLIKYGYKI